MPYGQIVIGPPGSGKTTYCNGMQQFLRAMGRKPILINLDPANDYLPYECDVNVSDLVSLEEVMTEHSFGPNGGLLFCMETLLANFDWLREKLKAFEDDSQAHFIFDLPGQVELFTNHDAVKHLIGKLERELSYRLVAVHLADSSYCREAARFISLATLTLQSMLCLECAQINLMSKFDLFKKVQIAKEDEEEVIPFPLSFYADCQNLQVLAEKTPNPALTTAISELINDFGLVSFIPFAVEDKECMAFVMQEIDKANGFVFGALTMGNETILQTAMTTGNREEYLESISQKYL